MTFTFSSEYSNTALVSSSCAGMGAFTIACIHAGASPALAAGAAARMPISTKSASCAWFSLIAGRSAAWLQNDLLFITCPHHLKKIAQRRIIFLFQEDQIQVQISRQADSSFIILRF